MMIPIGSMILQCGVGHCQHRYGQQNTNFLRGLDARTTTRHREPKQIYGSTCFALRALLPTHQESTATPKRFSNRTCRHLCVDAMKEAPAVNIWRRTGWRG